MCLAIPMEYRIRFDNLSTELYQEILAIHRSHTKWIVNEF